MKKIIVKLRRKLAKAIWFEEPENKVVTIRDYSPSADENARRYDEAMKWHRAEAERIHGRAYLRCLN